MKILFLILLAPMFSCEIQKEKYQNPRNRADLEQATVSDAPSAENLASAAVNVRLTFPQLLQVTGQNLALNDGPRYAADACNIRNRAVPAVQMAAALSKYLCVLSKSQIKLENQSIVVSSGVGLIAYRIRDIEDEGLEVSVCELGKRVARFTHLDSTLLNSSGWVSIDGSQLSDGRLGAMDGRFSFADGVKKSAFRYVANKSEVQVASLRFSSVVDSKALQFFSFAGVDLKLNPSQVVGASKYDSSLKKGVLFLNSPESKLGGYSYLDAGGRGLDDGEKADAELARGGRLDIKWSEISKPLSSDFQALGTGDWDCNTARSIEIDTVDAKSCESSLEASIDCEQEIFQSSVQTSETDYPSMTDRFDNLKFDIF